MNMLDSQLIERIRILRTAIDANTQMAQSIAEEISRGNGGREIALVITKLEEAKMWGGKALGARGRKLPEEYRDVYEGKE